ncbi:MAG: hypothetical protein KDE33_01495 [Bacteroidetes bacterium]|nr:hypothetical protein [Bacteroidota bacterium]
MKNPYEVLGVTQDATKKEIIKGKMTAMKQRIYTLQEIQLAEKQLLNPAKRLVADFMYPSKIKAKRPKLLSIDIKPENISINDINDNAFDSLK